LKHTEHELIDELIDKLIRCFSDWDSKEDHYLNVLIPRIVREPASADLETRKRPIVSKLHQLLSPEEWQRLRGLVKNRLYQIKEQREAERRKAEERRKRENGRRKAEELRRRKKADTERKKPVMTRIKNAFESNFLAADEIFKADPEAGLVGRKQYRMEKTNFVQAWSVREELEPPLDSEQAKAIAATDGDVLVVARAGSGKTWTLVTRAIFLLKHCRVAPHELLLLAFNRDAAEEMKVRLAKSLHEHLPHVMTFHALAHALVRPEENPVRDDVKMNQFEQSSKIQEVIDELIRSEEHHDHIREVMLSHFRKDWERIVDGGFELTMDELLDHRRGLLRESLKGDYVKSFGEKAIANALFEHDVKYKYERNFRWDGINYRPDFTIGRERGVIIEYFGLEGDADYDEMSDKKRAYWKGEPEWKFLEFSPKDIAQNGEEKFVQILLEKLKKAGISCKRLSEEEIWERVKRRAVDNFTKEMKNFISRCTKRNLTPDDLKTMIARHTTYSDAEALFLEVGVSVYLNYRKRVREKEILDFDQLMWRSVEQVRKGQTSFKRDKGKEHGDVSVLRFIMIDEFQDFSQMFFDLINAIRSKNPHVQFFCVGDDWQAIYAFAGSELHFTNEFTRYFLNTSKHYIRTNYRSPKTVVEVGNALMNGLGKAAQAQRADSGWVRLCKLDDFAPTAIEENRHDGDEITPALLRLVRMLLDRRLDIVILLRSNYVPYRVNYRDSTMQAPDKLERFLEHVRSYLPEKDRYRVTISTAHRYKGQERDAVIVLDAKERKYPLIHPNWVFLRVFGNSVDSIKEEERRLFYVALTRAKNSLAIFTETRSQSPYLAEIQRHFQLEELVWQDLPSVRSLDNDKIQIIVYDGYYIRKQLKKRGYSFKKLDKSWRKVVEKSSFSWKSLKAELCVTPGIRIEVHDENGKLLHKCTNPQNRVKGSDRRPAKTKYPKSSRSSLIESSWPTTDES